MEVVLDDFHIHLSRYSDRKTGSVPVIYVHGATFPAALAVGWGFADGMSWAEDMVKAGYDPWGFDFVGYGRSSRYSEMKAAPVPGALGRSDLAANQLSAVVIRVRSETGSPRVVLLAHSWGTIVAARLAAEQPNVIDRLILFGPILRREGGDASTIEQLTGWDLITPGAQLVRFREDVPKDEGELITDAMFAPWGAAYVETDPAAPIRNPPSVAVPNGPVADIIAARGGVFPYDPSRITCPVSIIRGAWDSQVTDKDVVGFKKSLINCPSFTDAKLERGTHLMHLETGRARLWTAARNALAEAKRAPIDAHAVIFEVEPSEHGREDYLTIAAALRPLLDEVDGFISIERFQSSSAVGRILSLSFWADEAAIAAWRSRERHHVAQVEGRSGIFKDYHLRVAHVLFDDRVLPGRQPLHESTYNDPSRRPIKYLGLVEVTGNVPSHLEQVVRPRRGVANEDAYTSLTNADKVVHLIEFASAEAARNWRAKATRDTRRPGDGEPSLRVRMLEVLRNYGMFDRDQAPQYLASAKLLD
jgi:heme-degrading monooxygenase HmoA/pimeloyl-ACP methyl ester carboxylesterase